MGNKYGSIEIKSFLAVTEFRSFTLAAKRVHISQSAMSKRIQKIENELNARLFIVDGSKITLTDAALQFIPYARQMLATYNNMLKSFKEQAKTLQHHIVVVPPHLFPIMFYQNSSIISNQQIP